MIDQDAVSSLESTIHQLLCHTAHRLRLGRQSLNDACGRDAPSASVQCFHIGSDVGDADDCAVSSCKDAPLEHESARSMPRVHPTHTRAQCWLTHRRHKGCTVVERQFAVPGACAPRSTATASDDSGEHDSSEAMPNEPVMSDDSEESGSEAPSYKCDGCRGSLYFPSVEGPH